LLPMKLFDQNGYLDTSVLDAYLRSTQWSIDSFKKMIDKAAVAVQVADLVRVGMYIPKSCVSATVSDALGEKTFNVLHLNAKTFKDREEMQLSEEQIYAFYKQHLEMYRVEEARDVQFWVVDPEDLVLDISKDELVRFYKKNKQKLFVSSPAKIRVAHLVVSINEERDDQAAMDRIQQARYEIINSPERFDEIVATYSDDSSTNMNGGLLEPFGRGEYSDKSIDEIAFSLTKDGEISDPVRTAAGLEIIKRVKMLPAVYLPFEEVQDRVRDFVRKDKGIKQFNLAMKNALSDAHKHAHDERVADFVEQHALTSQIKTGLFQRGVDANNKLVRHLFSIKKQHGYAYFWDNNKGYILNLTHIEPSFVQSFDMVKEKVAHDAQVDRFKTFLASELQIIRQKLQQFNNLQDIAKMYHKQSFVIENVNTATDTDRLQLIQKKGIPLALLRDMDKVNSIALHNAGPDGIFIIQLVDKKMTMATMEDTSYKMAVDSWKQQFEQQFYEYFIDNLKKNAKIDFNI
ncbi:MAG: peptidylprolyl isomerase, partial [Candidatus Babeliales bacterium]